MGLKSYILRGIRYVLRGIPEVNLKTEIVSLANNELLKGRTALITGGTSGIGFAIADAFLGAGANVFISGRDKYRIDNAIRNLKDKHLDANIAGLVLNNINIDQTNAALDQILKTCSFDILVNNAGINGGLLNSCSEEEYQNVMDTNLKGAIFITRVIANDMINKGIKGNILNICSSSSLRPANTAYALSKWGMRAYTLGLAKSLIKKGIVVNGIAPGPTVTPMLVKEGISNIYLPNNPSGRYALPEEIANMAVVLTSGMARMIVGDIVYITGGAGIITYDDITC